MRYGADSSWRRIYAVSRRGTRAPGGTRRTTDRMLHPGAVLLVATAAEEEVDRVLMMVVTGGAVTAALGRGRLRRTGAGEQRQGPAQRPQQIDAEEERRHEQERQQQQERIRLVSLSCLLVGVLAALTTPLYWQFLRWIGAWTGTPNWLWQAAFTFASIVPALVASTILLARGTYWTNGVLKMARQEGE